MTSTPTDAGNPRGARLHVLLIPEVGPQLADTHGLVMHAWQYALRAVPADQIHATLAWSGHRSQPRSRRSPAGQWSRPAWVPYGVRCEIGPDGTPSDRPPEAYATAATEALRAVFGDDKVPTRAPTYTSRSPTAPVAPSRSYIAIAVHSSRSRKTRPPWATAASS